MSPRRFCIASPPFRRLILLFSFGLGWESRAAAIVLYDGAANTTPNQQGWLYLTDPIFGAVATQAAAGGKTTLDTTAATSDKAGYFSRFPPLAPHPGVPVLNRATGFAFAFDVRVASESHNSADRAGFSVIALSSDNQGVELGFWTNEIWAQSDTPGNMFRHSEGVVRDTTAATTHYDLQILGSRYLLSAAGAAILGGPLRNYSAFGAPYTIANFLFLGDDTSSAQARSEINRIEVFSLTPGDANRDGLVNAVDYTAWRTHFGDVSGTALLANGDFNGDGRVTALDYTIWADRFATATPLALVPEPSAAILAACAGAAFLLIRRRR